MKTLYTLRHNRRTYIGTEISDIQSFASRIGLVEFVEPLGASLIDIPLQLILTDKDKIELPTVRVITCTACKWTGAEKVAKKMQVGNLSPVVIDICPECGGHNFTDI